MSDEVGEIYSAVVTPTEEARAEATRRGVELITPDPAFDVLPTAELAQPGPAPEMPEWLLTIDREAPHDVEQAFNALLLTLADDEFILGYRNSEWTGIAPMLEEDVAFSSISQDEIGHARLFYTLLAERIGMSADKLVYGRPPDGFRNSLLVERPRTNWAFTLVRQYLYDQYELLMLDALCNSSHAALASAASKVMREEKYHAMHGEIWMRRLSSANEDVAARRIAALAAAWPLALGLFEPRPGEAMLLASGILPVSTEDLRAAWMERVGGLLRSLDVPLPDAVDAAFGGREGHHDSDFILLWDEMTSVYRIDPDANW